MRSNLGRNKINEMCDEFTNRNISPGGSADLLAITVFFDLVREYIFNIK